MRSFREIRREMDEISEQMQHTPGIKSHEYTKLFEKYIQLAYESVAAAEVEGSEVTDYYCKNDVIATEAAFNAMQKENANE